MTLWSHHLVARPENQLTGVGFLFGGYHRAHGNFTEPYTDPIHGGTIDPGAYSVHRPAHWAFAGTGMEVGSHFGAEHTVVGYECDGCEFTLEGGLPVPTHADGTPASFQILASAPAGLDEGIMSLCLPILFYV